MQTAKELSPWGAILSGLPWKEIFASGWRFIQRTMSPGSQGMYEVLEYESILELKDIRGRRANFKKREKVRYLQDNVIAYQDQAWGDGQILLNYRSSPGAAVDFYRPARLTYILISLRGVKHRGDIDEFNIQWGMKDGFLRNQEAWETQVSHLTRQMKIQVIFLKSRPPLHVTFIEDTRHISQAFGEGAQHRLADGRWMVVWEITKPRQDERYIIKWEW